MKDIYEIYLDFDGTCVEHEWPIIGRCNYGCIEVIYKLQKAGHKIILNTYRADLNDEILEKSIRWFDNAWMFTNPCNEDIEIKIDAVLQNKETPWDWDWNNFKQYKKIYIDDIAYNAVLKTGFNPGHLVIDWKKLDEQFKENGLYE